MTREALILSALVMVKRTADQLCRRLGRRWHADFMSAGCVALCVAADRYRPNSAASFDTFAHRGVYGAMIDVVRRETQSRRFRNGRTPPKVFSLSEPEGKEAYQFADRTPPPGRKLEDADQIAALTRGLNPAQRRCIVDRYTNGKTGEEIASRQGVSRQAVHSMTHFALDRLRELRSQK